MSERPTTFEAGYRRGSTVATAFGSGARETDGIVPGTCLSDGSEIDLDGMSSAVTRVDVGTEGELAECELGTHGTSVGTALEEAKPSDADDFLDPLTITWTKKRYKVSQAVRQYLAQLNGDH